MKHKVTLKGIFGERSFRIIAAVRIFLPATMTTAVAFPPPSITADPQSIVTACEDAELMGETGPAGSGELRFVELAELASLLYLSDYTHARHLWRRHSSAATTDATSESHPELHQFALLWNVAKSMIAHNANGAFESLDACVQSGMQPLARYATELRVSYRERMIKLVVDGYSKITVESCRDMLGYGAGQSDEMVSMLKGRGWTRSGDGDNYLVPCKEEEEKDDDENEDEEAAPDHGDRIRELADIVGFMERSKLNL